MFLNVDIIGSAFFHLVNDVFFQIGVFAAPAGKKFNVHIIGQAVYLFAYGRTARLGSNAGKLVPLFRRIKTP